MLATLTARLRRFVAMSVLPTDDDATASRKRLVVGGGILTPIYLVGIGIVYLCYGEDLVGGLYVGFGIWIWGSLALFQWAHRRVDVAFWCLAVPALPIHLAVILSLGDLVHSGAVVLWGLAFPVATAVVFVSLRAVFPLFALFTINVVVTVFVGDADRSQLAPGPEHAILIANLLALSAFAVLIITIFVNQRDVAFQLLGDEQRKVRDLLLSILPEEIADELTRSPHVIADHFEDVSVLFADVVGFTPLSSSLTPVELVEVLDELFACFDDLVDQAGLEKIKTIGDCYMVASGIPRPRADHAAALVRLGLAMQDATRDREFHGKRLTMRVGINSGSVVAGVIGRRKFSYDLWGDVVNTASRMESHGVTGSVQITESTHALVHEQFSCAPRGAIEVKGKGALPVWVVEAPAARRPSPHKAN